jgi:hypothetical protein
MTPEEQEQAAIKAWAKRIAKPEAGEIEEAAYELVRKGYIEPCDKHPDCAVILA